MWCETGQLGAWITGTAGFGPDASFASMQRTLDLY
jgi:hypothetical protein